MVTQTRRSPDNSAPRRLPPGSSRLQANKHPAGGGSPEARCFGRGSSEKRTDNRRPHSAAAGSLAFRKFSRAGNFRRSRGGVSIQAAALAFVETEDTANFRVDIQFAKVGRLFRPLHGPAYAADKIGFMGAIPCSNPDLDKQEPAERCRDVWTTDNRPPTTDLVTADF